MAQFDLSITLEYGLVTGDNPKALVEIVNEWIADDWRPLGGPFVYKGDLCQAMVREKRPSLEFEIARATAMAK